MSGDHVHTTCSLVCTYFRGHHGPHSHEVLAMPDDKDEQIADLETQMSSMVSARDLEIRDLTARIKTLEAQEASFQGDTDMAIENLRRERDDALEAARKAEAESLSRWHMIADRETQAWRLKIERDEAVGLLETCKSPLINSADVLDVCAQHEALPQEAHRELRRWEAGCRTAHAGILGFLARLRARPAEKTSEPDANCITTPDGGCVGGPCMHAPPDEAWQNAVRAHGGRIRAKLYEGARQTVEALQGDAPPDEARALLSALVDADMALRGTAVDVRLFDKLEATRDAAVDKAFVYLSRTAKQGGDGVK